MSRLFLLLALGATANTIAQVRCNGCDSVATPEHINRTHQGPGVPEAVLRADRDKAVKDADELAKLASAVAAKVPSNDRNPLDTSIVKHLDEIDRIVKRIRKRLKRM